MFDTLSDKFEQTIRKLRGHGKITERNIEDAVREVRLALLEADVHFQVVKDFTERVRAQALGAGGARQPDAEQQFIKIVNAELTALMGGQAVRARPRRHAAGGDHAGRPAGLRQDDHRRQAGALSARPSASRSPYLVPADVYRPAAIEQLTTLGAAGRRAGASDRTAGGDPVAVCREALDVRQATTATTSC